ncbi:MAG: hypothetical protein ACTIMC_10940 [Kluyvera intermedia]
MAMCNEGGKDAYVRLIAPSDNQGRVGVDIANNEIVVLDKTRSLTDNIDEYHGHVRDWDALDNKQQSALIKSGKTTRKGKICGG